MTILLSYLVNLLHLKVITRKHSSRVRTTRLLTGDSVRVQGGFIQVAGAPSRGTGGAIQLLGWHPLLKRMNHRQM